MVRDVEHLSPLGKIDHSIIAFFRYFVLYNYNSLISRKTNQKHCYITYIKKEHKKMTKMLYNKGNYIGMKNEM